MERIESIAALDQYRLRVSFAGGITRLFDCRKYLNYEAFEALQAPDLFRQVQNGGYFVSWPNGADLSADTLFLEGTEDSPGA